MSFPPIMQFYLAELDGCDAIEIVQGAQHITAEQAAEEAESFFRNEPHYEETEGKKLRVYGPFTIGTPAFERECEG